LPERPGPDRDFPRGPGEFRRGRPPGPPGPRSERDTALQRAITLLEQLTAEHASVPEYRHLLACCYPDSPPGFRGRGSVKPNTDRAIELLRQLTKDFAKVPDYRLDLCETLARSGGPRRPPGPGPSTKSQERLEEA